MRLPTGAMPARPVEMPGIPENLVAMVVNGGLMRGLRGHPRMLASGAVFLREVRTAPVYRLWSINDRFPGMVRVNEGGASILAELYQVSREGFCRIVEGEADGLSVGRLLLDDGTGPLGVLGEPRLVEGMREITAFGGWRSYVESEGISQDW
jgi:hypothetical protein